MPDQQFTADELVQAAVHTVLRAALSVVESDSHHFSSRPCSSCSTLTGMLGEPFGCVRVRKERVGHD